ncbi:DUF2797 domain-containing protein [Candidatus Micrarchaeota archaeon]|nr:DUF2797 domain-containing protein [Candidatus Micrarchaeota archaeon]
MTMHLVYFKPVDREIGFWNEDHFDNLKLEDKIRMEFNSTLRCYGRFDGEEFHKCPNHAVNVKQCPFCRYNDISKVYTRMDFTGYEHIQDEIVNRDYAVYLAYFGAGMVKCGVTRKERVETRLREQAAVYWAEIMNFNNAGDAYEMERLLQTTFGFRNAVRTSAKLKGLFSIKREEFESALEKIKTSSPFPDFLIDDIKIRRNEFYTPSKFTLAESLSGRITEVRGNIVFFEKDSRSYAVDLNKKKGYEFEIR